MACKVVFSIDINSSDTVSFKNKTATFNLYEKNEYKQDLIALYMYYLPDFPSHGIKVGMTKCKQSETFYHAIKQRISKQTSELALPKDELEEYGNKREVIYWGVCLDAKNENFKDYYVHEKVIEKYSGRCEKEQERFINIPADKLISTFNEIRSHGLKKKIYTPRKEQQECIDALKLYFDKHPVGGRFLLNCKMRFGKSFTTYKFCEEVGLKKILILTFIPAVESSWEGDLEHIETDYKYFTDKDLRQEQLFFNLEIEENPFVMFLSLQNFLGKDRNSKEVKEKIKKLKHVDFDLVILDEYHFGARNQRTQEKFEDFDEEYQQELSKAKDVIEKFGIKTKKVICLSGTPFKAIARGEFTEENTFTYSYFDEQKNKYPNDNFLHPDPKYAHFPDMRISGYNMSHLFSNLTDQVFSGDKILGKKYFSLNKFFEVRKDSNANEEYRFVYEEEIKKWLNIIKGKSVFGDKFPYSQNEMLDNNKHTLWLMPSVNSCIAMAQLLKEDDYFNRYEIINLSAPGVGSGVDAFKFLNTHINTANNRNKLGSIALTVNKLTIGVTVEQWFSVFVLKDLASPEQYFQSIFRIQTPRVIDGDIKKKVGFVYDFNIDRAAALLLRYAEETADQSLTKLEIAKLIVKYLPIFMNGDMNKPIEYDVFYQLARFGDQSNVPLSKKIINLDATTHALNEETMAAMINDPEVSDVLKNVFAHSKLVKSKDRTKPSKPEQDGFETMVAKKGRDLGYKLGMEDSKDYVDLDDTEVQKTFEEKIEEYLAKNLPREYGEKERVWYINGFKKGYESGVNVPIKKLNCGYDDGIKFIDKIKEKFGENIHYTKETKVQIENFMNPYLNDINNIPEKYRRMLYKSRYVESFKRAVKNALRPVIKDEEGGTTVGDVNNILRHILARLVEFLYISVYRETTFSEIFKNADPDVFLEAVGITKKDFETLNKYHIFEEKTLNNYIHEFFVNESIGEDLASNNVPNDEYRNSFGWFGFNKVEVDARQYVNEVSTDEIKESVNDFSVAHDTDSRPIEQRLDNQDLEPIKTKENENQIELKDRIISLLNENPGGLRSGKIASILGVSKKEINRVLYSNKEDFKQDFLSWKLR